MTQSLKNPPANAGDVGSVLVLGRSPGGGNGNPLLCSCLENSMDRGAWQATVHGVAKSQTRLNTYTHTLFNCSDRRVTSHGDFYLHFRND